MDSSSVLHSYRSILSPNQKNDIRSVDTTQRTSPDEGQALMKEEEVKYESPVIRPQITVPRHA